MKSKILLAFCCLVSSFSFAQNAEQKIFFQEYFPLQNGNSYTYDWSFKPKGGDLKSGTDKTTCLSYQVADHTIYYFKKEEEDENELISSNSFTNGVCLYINGELFVSHINWKTELRELSNFHFEKISMQNFDGMPGPTDFHSFLPKEIEIGKTYTVQGDGCTYKFHFKGFEDLAMGGNEFKECLYVETEDIWPDIQYTGKLWFAKNIGVVKRIRTTGRTETIDQYYISK